MSVPRGRLVRIPWVILLVPLALAQEAERMEEPVASGMVESAERRLIQLDVSFTPKKKDVGLIVPELGPQDFDLVINTRPIRIDYADRICNVEQREVAVTVEPGLPGEPVTPRAVRQPYTFIFYIEHALLTMRGQNVALEMAEDLIPELIVDGNRGMVISSGRKLVQTGFSTDPEPLLEAIQRVRKDTAQWSEYAYAQGEELRYEEIVELPTIGSQRIAARAYQLEEMRLTSNRFRRLSATLGSLAQTDPPKAIFYFADMARQRPGEHFIKTFGSPEGVPDGAYSVDSPMAHSFAFDQVLNEANAQGVRLYTIQAQGMQVIPVGAASRRTTGAPAGRSRLEEAEDTMRGFALETGGEMFFGGTDASTMGRVRKAVERDFSCFYLLSFHATDLPEDQPLRVLLRMRDTENGLAADSRFALRTRGQLVVQSAASREQSLLLAAHLVSGAVDADPGRSVAIPLGFVDGTYQALVQTVVQGTDLSGGAVTDCLWDLGMTHVFKQDVADDVSARVGASHPATPIVLETVWEFQPGTSEIISVGREHRLGQLTTAQLAVDWPDPDKARWSVTATTVVQEIEGVFLRKSGDREEDLRRHGPVGVGQAGVRVDHPAFLVGLVCRGARVKEDVWVQRRLVGASTAEFEPLKWEFSGERCVQIRDLVRAGQLGRGDFNYEVRIFDNEQLEGQPLAEGRHAFTALPEGEPEPLARAGEPPA